MSKEDYANIFELFQTGICSTHKNNEIIMRPHEGYDNVYFIESGWAHAYTLCANGDIRIIHTYYSGDIFSLIYHSEEQQLHVGVMALGSCRVWRISRQRFIRAREASSALTNEVMHQLTNCHMQALTEREYLQYRSAEERIMYRLKTLANHFGQPGHTGTIIEVPINNTYLARSTHLTRETASRQMSLFIQRGEIMIKNGRVHILDTTAFDRIIS